MKAKHYKTILIVIIGILFILLAALYTASTAYAGTTSPFIGTWYATDWDGSDSRLVIAGKPNGPFQITITDSYISFCDGGAGIIRGKGWLNPEDPNLLEAKMKLVCFTTGKTLDFHSTWRYFPSTGMVVSGWEDGYVTLWHRRGPPTPTPPELYLRVNYGHDWVESFYEAGHVAWVTVTESDGVTIKATAQLVTEPKDYWNWEPGFQTTPEVWIPAPPDIRAKDWVYGWVDNGASAKVQIGEINGSVDILTDSVTGNIYAPWISEDVVVECHSWGAPLPGEIIKYDQVMPDGSDTYSCSWINEWDIQPGQMLGVGYFDPAGNWIANMLMPPWIRAHPEWNNVDAWFWPENKILQLTVDDPKTEINPDVYMEMSGEIDPNVGTVWFELDGYDLKPGDIVTLTDGIVLKVMIVSNLTINSVVVNSDIVEGSADPGDMVRLPIPGELIVFADDSGEWIADFANAGFDVQPGTTMIAEESEIDWDTTSYEVWVQNLAITVVDEIEDTVAGTADEGGVINVWPHATGQQLQVTTGPDGTWQVDFSEIFDLVPNECGRAEIYDSEGNGTAIDWCVPFTLINVFPDGNYVEIHDWRQGVTATASIVGKEGCTGTTVPIYPDWEPQYRDPMAIFSPEGCDIVADDVVIVDNGITYREHIVQNLSVVAVDGSADTVSGTADPGANVLVWPHGFSEPPLHPTVEGDGSWTADFSEWIDLLPDMCGRSAIFDEAGNSTSVDWCVPNPYFDVRPNDNSIGTWNWSLGELTLKIYSDGIEDDSPDYTTTGIVEGPPPGDPRNFLNFALNGVFDIQPGYLVTLSDGTLTKRTVVTPLAFEASDVDADTVSGYSVPGSVVHVWACDASGCYTRHVTAGEDGKWIADWSVPGSQEDEQNILNLVNNLWVDSAQSDEDGDNTMFGRTTPVSPHFTIFPEWEWYDGLNWPDVAQVTITVDGKEDPCTAYRDSWGGFFNGGFPEGCDVVIGDTVRMKDGTTTQEHTVRNLAITVVDEIEDTVAGTADEGAVINVWPHATSQQLQVTTGPVGTWQVDFSGMYDLQPGECGRTQVYDEDGNGTAVDWCMPNPYFDVRANVDEITTVDWPLGELTVNIYASGIEVDPPDFSITGIVTGPQGSDPRNFLGFYLNGIYDIQPGYLITVSDGQTTKSSIVTPLSFDTIDIDADTVSGHTTPGSKVDLWACDNVSCPVRHVIANGEGIWIADWSVWGPQEDEYNTLDLVEGTWVDSRQGDEDNDSTMYGLTIPFSPRIYIYPEWEWYDGLYWPDGAQVTITIVGKENPCTATQESWGGFFNGGFPEGCDVVIGDTVRMTDGTTTLIYTVQNLAILAVDGQEDTVTGTADEGTLVFVWPHATGQQLQAITGVDGTWQADFSGMYDLQPGECGRTQVYDEDGNGTAVDWCVPNPYFTIFPETGRFEGFNWPDGAIVTITVGGREDRCTSTVESWGGFFDGGFPEGCGELYASNQVRMTDGTTTLQHTVRNLSISEWNTNADTLTGWAYRGAQVVVWLHGYDYAVLTPIAGSDGSWMADFSTIPFDLDYGIGGRVMIYDIDDGNATAVDWQISLPTMQIWMEWNTVGGIGWNRGEVVTLTVGDVQLIQPTDGTRVFFNVGEAGHDIVPGDLIQMTNGQIL
ncbi:MAG: hypothetical protein A2Z71_02800 [Chloroflexi bacterium RBG_13_50_21]|nr:MAG: hypothetical protein A2Z71_02800 [Chloroflexi bacterium RBG_13_50_21]